MESGRDTGHRPAGRRLAHGLAGALMGVLGFALVGSSGGAAIVVGSAVCGGIGFVLGWACGEPVLRWLLHWWV